MSRALRAIFVKVGADGYGPKASNPIYAVTDPSGRTWHVSRHHWVAPCARWAWVAEARDGTRDRKYADTLIELAVFEFKFPGLDK